MGGGAFGIGLGGGAFGIGLGGGRGREQERFMERVKRRRGQEGRRMGEG